MLRMRSAAALFAGAMLGAALSITSLAQATDATSNKASTKVDHSKFKNLQHEFKSGPEVTKACLVCHTDAAKQVHKTKHWTWESINPEMKQKLGKKNVLNNFCISIPKNYASCTTCHVGYGWKDKNFDFTAEHKVDCLVCHDTTGGYKKQAGMGGEVVGVEMEFPEGSGKILKPINLSKIAQKVGKSSRDTCGACHFFGGGGDGVKRGDMDSSLSEPEAAVDVHMDVFGLDFTCATCHATSSHGVRGKSEGKNAASCVTCHSNAPHNAKNSKHAERLNSHTKQIACQTCHIPAMARGGVATKMAWDWSTAGQLGPDGKQFVKKDEKGRIIYESRKGDFVVGENVMPEYFWFNGDISYTQFDAKIDPSKQPISINKIGGNATDGKSKIWPMKVSRGKQPYDSVNMTLLTPHTTGDAGYWKTLDWGKALASGALETGVPFSGKFDFVSTEMYRPLSHMVAPKDKAVGCAECHTKGGRLENIKGIYIPGRDTPTH